MTLPTQNGKPRVAFEVRTDEETRDYLDSLKRADRPEHGRYQHNISRNATLNRIFRILRLFGINSTEDLRDRLKSSDCSSKKI